MYFENLLNTDPVMVIAPFTGPARENQSDPLKHEVLQQLCKRRVDKNPSIFDFLE